MSDQAIATLESLIVQHMEGKQEMSAIKERQQKIVDQIYFIMQSNDKRTYSFSLNDRTIGIEIGNKVSNKLQRELLARELSLEPKELKTKRLIEKAHEGVLTVDTYEACHHSEVVETLKFRSKKMKPKKKKSE